MNEYTPHPDCWNLDYPDEPCEENNCGHKFLPYDGSEADKTMYRELLDHMELYKKNAASSLTYNLFKYYDELLLIKKSNTTKSARF